MKSRALITVLLLAVSCSGVHTGQQAEIGHWSADGSGLPAYSYMGALPFTAFDEKGNVTEQPEDPYFLLGNRRITLIPHVSGIVEVMTAERAWARVNASAERPDYGVQKASLTINGEAVELLGVESAAASPELCSRLFGLGHATWEYHLPDGITCRRTVSVAPSCSAKDADAAFSTDITLTNAGNAAAVVSYRELLPVNYTPMGVQMTPEADRVVLYSAGLSTDGKTAAAEISAQAGKYYSIPEKWERSPYDFYPEDVFLTADDGSATADENALGFASELVLQPGESRTLTFVTSIGRPYPARSFSGADWKAALPDLSAEEDSVLRREMLWNAHFLEASAKYSSYYDEVYVPQGSVYSYHFGDNIAARDLAQGLLPAVYTNPALAKSALRHLLMHTHPDGEIERGDAGFGYCIPTVYQESDSQLYVFMAVGEYLRVTGDYAFLDEKIALAPSENGRLDTVEGVLGRQFTYLRDVIGTGEHGLVRLLNSDWSDSFLHKYSPNVTVGDAESHLNSAMASAVIPELTRQLRCGGKNALADALEAYRKPVLDAFLKELEGRAYCARAYVAGELFGDKTVCIEPHSYLFSIPEISPERKREIYDNIYPEIAEPWGLRTRNKPLWDKAPEGEDGGVWFALEYPLLLGVSSFDKEEARRLLGMLSFENYARTHPDYWVGRWTAPDELNSSLSRDGLYAFWTDMPDYRLCFQGWCCHAHSWPLYCYFKLNENEL